MRPIFGSRAPSPVSELHWNGFDSRRLHQITLPTPVSGVADRPLTDSVSGVYSQRAMRFEWDSAKDAANRKKHGVSFREATEVFAGEADCLEIFDETHSDEEDRFIAVGKSTRGVLVVVYTEPESKVLRIVSARMATRNERLLFERYERERYGR